MKQEQLLKLINEVDRDTSAGMFRAFVAQDLPENDYSDAADITELLTMIVKSIRYFKEEVFESEAIAETNEMLIREYELDAIRSAK